MSPSALFETIIQWLCLCACPEINRPLKQSRHYTSCTHCICLYITQALFIRHLEVLSLSAACQRWKKMSRRGRRCSEKIRKMEVKEARIENMIMMWMNEQISRKLGYWAGLYEIEQVLVLLFPSTLDPQKHEVKSVEKWSKYNKWPGQHIFKTHYERQAVGYSFVKLLPYFPITYIFPSCAARPSVFIS